MSYKILSLDGGGSRALIQARVLFDLYGDLTGHELLRKFDLVIANSGGSVLLGLICTNRRLSDIVAIYRDPEKLKRVFPRLRPFERFWERILRWLDLGPKYSTARKLEGLREVMGTSENKKEIVDTYFNELPGLIGKNESGRDVLLVISAFDYFRERVSFFRSDPNTVAARFSPQYFQVTLGEAIHASTNAPVSFYDRPATLNLDLLTTREEDKDKRQSWFMDGGLTGFNNPILAGLVEAITNNPTGIDLKKIFVLSLGTGLSRKAVIADDGTSSNRKVQSKFQANVGKPFVEWKTKFNVIEDAKKAATSVLADPPDSATFIACSFLNPSLENEHNNVVRINPFITPDSEDGIYVYPAAYQQDQENFLKLMKLQFDLTKKDELALIDTLCDRFIINSRHHKAIKNQLIRGQVATDSEVNTYLGYPSYLDAKERWLTLTV